MSTGRSLPVAEYVQHSLSPALGRVIDLAELAPAPTGDRVAMTASLLLDAQEPPQTSVQVVDLQTGDVRRVGGTGHPVWSGDGTRLACADGPSTVIVTNPDVSFTVPGTIEYLRFAPHADKVLVGAAGLGADRSTAQGSGQVEDEPVDGRPRVDDHRSGRGWRGLWTIDLRSGEVRPVPTDGWTIWEADWSGEGFVAIASRAPGESSWYTASLIVGVPGQEPEVIATSPVQFGHLRGAPRGDAIAVVEGVASDRGLLAGELKILDLSDRSWTTAEIDADVTSVSWRGNGTLLVAGQRDLTTVVAEFDRVGRWLPCWTSEDRTCGGWYPEAVPVAREEAGSFLAVVHSYDRPPALTIFSGRAERCIVDTAHPGTDFEAGVGGSLQSVEWSAPDGQRISGLLATPEQSERHPLVVLIHGGPVAAYRPSWQLIYGWTRLLVARGYAVLHPNPRGSGGRGQEFAGAVFGDIGGADTEDIITGVDALAARGLIDPGRVAVAGRSYGGYLSAWLATQHDRWAAVIAQSPMTDWVSLHLTTNIGYLDDQLLGDVITNLHGRYLSRSPVHFVDRVNAPVLSIAGELDRATPPAQALELHNALLSQGKESTLVIYPTEGHHIVGPAARQHLMTTIVDFLDEHLAR